MEVGAVYVHVYTEHTILILEADPFWTSRIGSPTYKALVLFRGDEERWPAGSTFTVSPYQSYVKRFASQPRRATREA